VDQAQTVALPGVAVAAASDTATVWCVAGGELLAYEASGSLRFGVAAPDGLGSLAAGADALAAALEPGVIAWLNPRSGEVQAQLPVGGEPIVLAGGGAIWAFDPLSGRAWRLAGVGSLARSVSLSGADLLAPDGARLWWTSREDTLLRGADRPVDIGVDTKDRGAMVACAGSVWISAPYGLRRVGAWAGDAGPPLLTPEQSVRFLTCAQGILVGGSGRHGLFVLDPSIDVGVRHLDVDLGGDLDFLVATQSIVWAFPAEQPEARLVTVRLGERSA
jgi:hypothetical protein